jgi:hypothetical protein
MSKPFAGYQLHDFGEEIHDDNEYRSAINDLSYLFFVDSQLGLTDKQESMWRRLLSITEAFERKRGW